MKKTPEAKQDLALALLKSGKTYREIAEALDMSVSTVHGIAKGPREDLEPLVREIKSRLSFKYLLLADHLLSSISPSDIYKASLKEETIAAAILTDKAASLESAPSDPPTPSAFPSEPSLPPDYAPLLLEHPNNVEAPEPAE